MNHQIKVLKKRDELNQEKIRKLQLEAEEYKEAAHNSNHLSSNKDELEVLQVQDLEQRIVTLQHELQIARVQQLSSEEEGRRMVDLEGRLSEESRVRGSLEGQLRLMRDRMEQLQAEN